MIAHFAFWILLVWGWWFGDLSGKRVGIFVGVWIAGAVGLGYVPMGGLFFVGWVAILDVVLVFLVAKGDIKITTPWI